MSEESLVSTPMICSNGHQRRVKLTDQQFEKMTREEVRNNWHEQDLYIDILESQIASQEGEIASLRESEERMRQQHLESTHREKVLVRRLATKEQEMQEYASQIAEFKAGQTAGSSALRSALLDPAVNLLMQSLRNELVATKTRLEETQNELSAWKFTPDSNTGKRLMAKCRLLYQENEELGRMISSGRLAKLEGELALQKRFSDEVKKSQSELDEFLQELDEDVDGMQSTIYYLQQELKKSKEAYMNLQKQINSQVTEAPAGSVDTNKSVNIKDTAISTPDEVKSDPEFSSQPTSPLLKDEPVSQTMEVKIGIGVENGKINEEVQESLKVKEMPCDQIGGIATLNIEFSSGGKIAPEEKVASLEERIIDSGTTEAVNEVIENDNNEGEEMTEEKNDLGKQGDLINEVGTEPRHTDYDEEVFEKTKFGQTIGLNNPIIPHQDNNREDEEDPPLPKSTVAPQEIIDSSDEDSDDAPLIKKVRRNHELVTRSKV
ncbi:pre-mRNA-splicing regulator WTAP-like isoform X1 [Hetaerina americana]|uniref:pre-mRNA-splicing regulator WTAP-like isoform X1 n=1 Tax=Hetaerina americana TaxID=62018 RepID=UPI003A7F2A16